MIRFLFTITLVLTSVLSSFSDGTKQLRKTETERSCIQINDGVGTNRFFATYQADSSQRLYFTIVNALQEVVLFGFQLSDYTPLTYFHIKDKAGNIVYSTRLVPASGDGYIMNYNQAVAGPNDAIDIPNTVGYAPLKFIPTANGDYYIEFNTGDPIVIGTTKKYFDLFDLSVVNKSTHKQISGRVWSRAWDFSTKDFANPFTANLYIYTDDGVVTEVNFNGMKPFGFVVSSNQTGTRKTLTPNENRRSIAGNVNYPQYKIFLTYPDPLAFPTGVAGAEIKVSNLKCYQNNYCLSVTVGSSGLVEVLLNLNGQPGYQKNSEDILLDSNVTQAGEYCFSWNGKNGLGSPVETNKEFQSIVTYTKGLTHLPLYDVEGHPNGYIVKTIVPDKQLLKLFWDDSNITNGTAELLGCTPDTSIGNGCHGWASNIGDVTKSKQPLNPANFGDDKTINTWWYATLQTDTAKLFVPGPLDVAISSDHPLIGVDTALLCPKASITLVNTKKDTIAPTNNTYKWYLNNQLVYTGRVPKLDRIPNNSVIRLIMTDNVTNCIATDTFNITVKEIKIPNLITPNGDSMNDTFEIENIFPNTQIDIYNKWGDRVYKNENYDNSWGNEVKDGVYYYSIRTNEACGDYKGWIQIIHSPD